MKTSKIFRYVVSTLSLLFVLCLLRNVNAQDDYNLSFNIYSNNYYSSNEDVSISITAYYLPRNATFNFKIYRILDIEGFFSRQTSNYTIDVLSKDSLNLLSLCEEVDSFDKRLKVEGSSDYYYSYETINYKPKHKGAFLVRASYKNKVAYAGFFVSNIGMVSEAGFNGMLAYMVDKKTGEPLNGAELSFMLGQKKIGSGQTVNGIFFKEMNDGDRDYAAQQNIAYPLVIGRYGDEVAVSDPYLYFGYGGYRYAVYIHTNQPVYRPKSKVEFKGTVRKNGVSEYVNVGVQDVTVKIKDSKYAEVYKQVVKTNSNGSFAESYEIPDNAPLGTYYIYAELGEGQIYTGTFTVEEYKKPEYKVDITVDKDQYSNGDIIRGIVNADYYFGSPVQDAKVEYNVYKKTFYKPWWYFSEYRWWYEDYYEGLDENQKFSGADFIYSGTGELNKEGRFDFDYTVKEDFKAKHNYYWWYDKDYSYESDFMYIIQAKVTDKSRREISSTKTIYVTRAEYFLTANMNKYWYKTGEKAVVEIGAFDFGEKPVATSFQGSVNKITWGKYPDYKQEKSFVTSITGMTRADGKGSAIFETNGDGYYQIDITSLDKNGKKVTATTYCYVSDGDFSWWYNQAGGIQIITDKETYKPGEICKAVIFSSEPNVNALITTENQNILSYRLEKIEGSSKTIEIPVESSGTPNFYINVSYVANGQFYNGSKSVMVIPESKFLSVEIATDKPTYKPKEEGTVKVKVTDNNGNPVSNAEVSLGIVDESIYAIQPDKTKDVRKFFYSPGYKTVYPHYSNAYSYYGYSRMITIYERFNVKSTSETELGTIKGRLVNKTGNPIAGASIVIDGDFYAANTDSDGNFEFKLPAGEYTVGIIKNKKGKSSEVNINLRKGQILEVRLTADSELLLLGQYQKDYEESGLVMDEVTLQSGRTKDDAPKSTEKSMDKRKLGEYTNGKGEFKKEKDGDDFKEADLRSDFRDAIYWSPSVETDANGYATVSVKYPDNLTTWRMTARVITGDTKVGQIVNTVITRKDLLVRIETPRFFQQKDEVTISTIIHNYLSEEKTTKLTFKGENIEVLNSEKEQTITLGKNEEKRIDWKVRVTDPVGFAKLTASALTNEESDAVEVKVPLQPHGLMLAEYQSMDMTDVNKTEYKFVHVPKFTDLRSAGLKLNVSPSLASTMLGALDELVGYPYGCVEQTMSRFLPTVIVANAFKDLNAPLSDATKKDLPKMVEAGFNRLYSMQHYDGGWGWWTNDQSNPFMTSYVIYGLYLGSTAGYEPKSDVMKKGITSLKLQMKNESLDPTTRAYMLYTLSYVESKDTKFYEEQLIELNKKEVNDYARSLISMAAANFGDKETAKAYNTKLKSNVQAAGETGAFWGGTAWHYNWQEDKVQTTAMALKALLNAPEGFSDNTELLNKAVRWLMMQRQGGGWWNTQSTAFIIYAMVDYLKTSKELEPDYSVQLFVNDELVLDKKMTKENVFEKEQVITIENNKLRDGQNDIKIVKSGNGKLYLSSNLSYYTNEEKIAPRENGFRVEREYFKLEKYTTYSDNKIIYRKRYFDGQVKSGDEILVKVRVSSKEQLMQYFMLEDPIPAGCEVIKDDWAYKIDEEKDYTGWEYYWWRWWYADKDIRDNRVTFFATYLYGDTYEFSYIMRAQIPGVYNVIPATGMLMYYPEVRGSSEEMKIEIRD